MRRPRRRGRIERGSTQPGRCRDPARTHRGRLRAAGRHALCQHQGRPQSARNRPPRQKSRLDRIAGEVLETCAELLHNTGVYAIYIGFNSSEVRTESIFNPFPYEVHDAEDLVKPGYTTRHFIAVPYEEKMRTVAWVRAMVQTGPLRHYLPPHWLKLMDAERTSWQPLAADRIDAPSCKASILCAASRRTTCATRRFHFRKASCGHRTTATAPISCGRIISRSLCGSIRRNA